MKKARVKKERYPDFPLRRPRKQRPVPEASDVGTVVTTPRGEFGTDPISEAIKRRKVVEFRYAGTMRTVEPHCYGVSRAGNQVLRAYETGEIGSGRSTGWRLFNVNKMVDMRDTGRVFGENRPGYNPKDRGMALVHCNL